MLVRVLLSLAVNGSSTVAFVFVVFVKKLRNRLLEYFDTNTKTFHSEIKDMDALKARIALLEQCRKDDEEMENKIKPIEDKYAKLQEFEAGLSLQLIQIWKYAFHALAALALSFWQLFASLHLMIASAGGAI